MVSLIWSSTLAPSVGRWESCSPEWTLYESALRNTENIQNTKHCLALLLASTKFPRFPCSVPPPLSACGCSYLIWYPGAAAYNCQKTTLQSLLLLPGVALLPLHHPAASFPCLWFNDSCHSSGLPLADSNSHSIIKMFVSSFHGLIISAAHMTVRWINKWTHANLNPPMLMKPPHSKNTAVFGRLQHWLFTLKEPKQCGS